MITRIWQWITDPANWGGAGGIGARLGEHLTYSVLVLLLAALVAVPVGLWVGHTGRGRWLVNVANGARAVPTLGLLFALALWLGPYLRGSLAFLLPTVVVLVILAIPPILSGAYAGVESVEPVVRDAARGMGMTPGQILRRIEIPCATPLLLSGLRAAMLQTIATATIAAYVGVGGLGRFLIDGLALGDYQSTAAGAVLVALLAITVDLVLLGIERLVTPRGLTVST